MTSKTPKCITLDAFYLYRPLAGQYEGVLPKPEQLVDRAHRMAADLWGARPTLVDPPGAVQPTMRAAMAWLVGPALEEGDDGSELVVIWFPLWVPTHPMDDAIGLIGMFGGWDKLAKGYAL